MEIVDNSQIFGTINSLQLKETAVKKIISEHSSQQTDSLRTLFSTNNSLLKLISQCKEEAGETVVESGQGRC